MYKKIFLIILIFLAPFSLQAEHVYSSDELELQQILNKLPHAGIEIVPLAEMDLSPEELAATISHNNESKTMGYIKNTISTYPKQLLNIRQQNNLTSASDSKSKDQYNSIFVDTHMKTRITNIKLAFKFNGLDISPSNVIGFAPIGGYVSTGWTGIKEFFIDKSLGTCAFTINNMALLHGGVKISKEAVRYDVNKKPGTLKVEGSNSTGFIYHIDWFDQQYEHDLECANSKYDKKLTESLIAFAQRIDANFN